MTSDAVTWVIAGLEVVMAIGIAAYWFVWLRQPHDEPWLPAGFVDHETPFVFTDAILSAVLVTGAILQVTGQPAGDSLGLIAAGMLVFLGILDLGYFARTGMFQRDHDGLINAGVVVSVLVMAVVLAVRFF